MVGVFTMAGNKKFRRALFGFRKKDVLNYINDISLLIDDKENEIKVLNDEISRLCKEIEEKNKKTGAISDAIMRAEEYSKEIIAKAENSADEIRMEISREFEGEKEKLEAYKKEVESFRERIAETLESFNNKL